MTETEAPLRASSMDAAMLKARRAARLARQAHEKDQRARLRELITPEGAALHLRIATASERAGAFMIDFILQILLLLAIIITIALTASEFGVDGGNIAGALILLMIFLIRNFYWIAFEIGRKAATPGKRLLGLRVAARNGGHLTAGAVLARNFTREVEIFLPLTFLLQGTASDQPINAWIALLGFLWSGTFLFLPFFNRDKLRAGDIIAGTWVIHTPKAKLMGDIARAGPLDDIRFQFTPAQLDAYGIHELQVLERVLRQKATSVRATVAEKIRNKIDWSAQPGETDKAFLDAYYAALRRHLESALVLGRRKADKYDK